MIIPVLALSFAIGGCTSTKIASIVTDPSNATISIDGKRVGTSPIEHRFEFSDEKGTYDVEASFPGHFPGTAKVEYLPRDKTRYFIKLEKLSKTLKIDTAPSGATLYINGKQVGVTPYTDDFFFDRDQVYQVTAKSPMREDAKMKIAFEPKEKKEYLLELPELREMEMDVVDYEIVKTKEGRVSFMVRPRKARSLKEVIERSPNVKSVSKVTTFEDPTVSLGSPVISPEGNEIVYPLLVKEQDQNDPRKTRFYSNLWKQKIGSQNKTRVTFGNFKDLNPAYDSSGKYIYFSSDRNTMRSEIWRIGASGAGGITKITSSQAENIEPTIGNEIVVFTSVLDMADNPQIWTIGVNGNLLTQLREGESTDISHDGKRILFVRFNEHTKKKQIWSMDLEGSNETLLSTDPNVNDEDPRWSPDDESIIFTSDAGKDSSNRNNKDIWIMKADGSGRTQLTTNGSEDDHPCWDPSGRFIYFRSNRGFQYNIWRFEISKLGS